jgi:hypothetical protein
MPGCADPPEKQSPSRRTKALSGIRGFNPDRDKSTRIHEELNVTPSLVAAVKGDRSTANLARLG